MNQVRHIIIWFLLLLVIVAPLALAAHSPLLQWREPIYIVAGFAGVVALAILLCQPLLAAGFLPGLKLIISRLIHRWLGMALLLSVVVHIVGLWITSPPDVIDALLFASPTPFSIWGVIAMWAIFATTCLAVFRFKLRLSAKSWRRIHKTLGLVIVVCSVLHALLIDGTMELRSKIVLCMCALLVTIAVVIKKART